MRRMPAEWERHAATWVVWPHSADTWPGCLTKAQAEFETLVRTLAESERVHILVQDDELARDVAARLRDIEASVHLHEVATDDAWMRDIGPTFVEDTTRGMLAIDWQFNSWGGKYPPGIAMTRSPQPSLHWPVSPACEPTLSPRADRSRSTVSEP